MQTMTAKATKRRQKKRPVSPAKAKHNAARPTAAQVDAMLAKVGQGHPPKYQTAEALGVKMDEYFRHCETTGKLPSISGLSVYIELFSDNFLDEQARRGEEFSKVVKRCKMQMMDAKFQSAASGKMNPTIFIFDAVNNHGCINTRTENKNDNRNTGRVEIEAISISLVPSPPLPAADTRPVIDCDPVPMIEHDEAE